MTTDTLRLGLIGAGNHASFYREVTRTCAAAGAPAARIVAVADAGGEQLEKAKETFGIDERNCFVSAAVMLGMVGELDAVIVATPPEARQPVLRVLEHGCHVWCENPLAVTFAGCQNICRAAEETDRIVTVNEQWRWLPAVLKLQDLCRDGAIGELREIHLRGKGRKAAVELSRIGSHLLSVVIHRFTGELATTLRGDSVRVYTPLHLAETTVDLDLAFNDDPAAQPTGYDVRRCYLELIGTEGRLLAKGGFLEDLWVYTSPEPPELSPRDTDEGGQLLLAGWKSVRDTAWPGPVWSIVNGAERRALSDPFMNPSFWLFGEWLRAIAGDGENPYPPRDFLPVAAAMDMVPKAVGGLG